MAEAEVRSPPPQPLDLGLLTPQLVDAAARGVCSDWAPLKDMLIARTRQVIAEYRRCRIHSPRLPPGAYVEFGTGNGAVLNHFGLEEQPPFEDGDENGGPEYGPAPMPENASIAAAVATVAIREQQQEQEARAQAAEAQQQAQAQAEDQPQIQLENTTHHQRTNGRSPSVRDEMDVEGARPPLAAAAAHQPPSQHQPQQHTGAAATAPAPAPGAAAAQAPAEAVGPAGRDAPHGGHHHHAPPLKLPRPSSPPRPASPHESHAPQLQMAEAVPTANRKPLLGSEDLDELQDRVETRLTEIEGPPMTLQRFCELLCDPERYYQTASKLLRAMDKLLQVPVNLAMLAGAWTDDHGAGPATTAAAAAAAAAAPSLPDTDDATAQSKRKRPEDDDGLNTAVDDSVDRADEPGPTKQARTADDAPS